MKNGIFARLSVEDNEQTPVSVEMDPTEVIAQDEDSQEFASIAQECMADVASMDAAAVAGDRLEVQVAVEEKMLETPEAVTAGAVLLAQESMTSTIAMLADGDTSMMESFKVSAEAMDSDAAASLKVSNEGAKEVLKSIYNSVKLMLKKVANGVKKLAAKLVVVLNNVEKNAKKLGDKVKKSKIDKPANAEFSEKTGKVLIKKFAAVMVGEGKSELTSDIVTGSISAYDTSVSAALTESIKAIDGLRMAANSADAATAKKTYEDIKAVASNGSKAMDALEKDFGYKKPDGIVGVNVVFANATTCKVVEISLKEPKGDEASDYQEALRSVSFRAINLTADTSSILDKKVKVPASKSDLEKIIKAIEAAGKNVKKFSDARIKEIDGMEKELDKLAKDSTENAYLAKMRGNVMNSSRALIAGVYLDSIIAYSSVTKNGLSYVKEAAAQFKANDI